MDKKEILDILDSAKDEKGDVPMRIVRRAFDKLFEPCEGTVSRQVAIDAVHKNYDTILDFKSDGRTVADSFECIINALPSAQPVLTCKGCKYDYYECVQCRNCLRKERDLYEPE